ncbi:MAG: NAD(P)H-dependent oxidoreductase [Proteobacteria bacterium]|nr:NAD(P)H-dependent oxidoreductase [Pseudomonadota bacterium]
MGRILYVKGSPRGERSHSLAVADRFLEAYARRDPAAEVAVHDLAAMRLPALDAATLEAKYAIMHGSAPSADAQRLWRGVESLIGEFLAAEKYVFAVPMWNFGIPYALKHYLDVVIQPGYTFSFSPEKGYAGLAGGRPAFISYASGGEYEPGTGGEALDHCRSYMKLALSFIGITDVRHVAVEPTMQRGEDEAARRRDAAIERALAMADGF